MHDLGAGGVRVGQPISGPAPVPAALVNNIVLSNSTLEDGGYITEAGCGVLLQQATNSSLVHNEIRNFKYT